MGDRTKIDKEPKFPEPKFPDWLPRCVSERRWMPKGYWNMDDVPIGNYAMSHLIIPTFRWGDPRVWAGRDGNWVLRLYDSQMELTDIIAPTLEELQTKLLTFLLTGEGGVGI